MMKVSKTNPPHLYINILDFKDVEEQMIIYAKIQELIKEWSSKRKVFGQ